MIFFKADANSLSSIENVLQKFSMLSGFHVNRGKSSQIFTGISMQDRDNLVGIT